MFSVTSALWIPHILTWISFEFQPAYQYLTVSLLIALYKYSYKQSTWCLPKRTVFSTRNTPGPPLFAFDLASDFTNKQFFFLNTLSKLKTPLGITVCDVRDRSVLIHRSLVFHSSTIEKSYTATMRPTCDSKMRGDASLSKRSLHKLPQEVSKIDDIIKQEIEANKPTPIHNLTQLVGLLSTNPLLNDNPPSSFSNHASSHFYAGPWYWQYPKPKQHCSSLTLVVKTQELSENITGSHVVISLPLTILTKPHIQAVTHQIIDKRLSQIVSLWSQLRDKCYLKFSSWQPSQQRQNRIPSKTRFPTQMTTFFVKIPQNMGAHHHKQKHHPINSTTLTQTQHVWFLVRICHKTILSHQATYFILTTLFLPTLYRFLCGTWICILLTS
jgi:hypothetical protein